MSGARRRDGSGVARRPLPAGFLTIWTTVAIDLIGFGIILPLLPQYAERLGATPASVGVLVASFSVAQLCFAPVWGRLSDRIGRKPILIVSLFGTAIGSLLTGIAGSVWLLFVARVLDGASGASVSVAQAAAADLAEPRDRPRVMGLIGAAFGVGFVAGPALGALGALGGTHVPFFLAAAISFVNAIVAIVRLPETHHLVDSAADDAEWIAAAPSLDGAGIVEPAHVSAPGAVPAADVSAIRRLIAVGFTGMVAFSGFEATFALLGERRFGFRDVAIGVVFTVIGIGLVIVQGSFIAPVTRAMGEQRTMRLGLALNAAGLAVLAIDGGWVTLTLSLVALVVGQGLLSPTISSMIAGRAGRARGTWLGWHQSASGVARVAGPVLAGVLFEQVSVSAPYLVGAVLVALALALSL